MKLFQIVKRVTTIISGVVNMRMTVKPAGRVTVQGTLLVPERAGSLATIAPAAVLMLQRAAARVTSSLAGTMISPVAKPAARVTASLAGTQAKPEAKPGGRITFVEGARFLVSEKPALQMVQASINLEHKSFVVTMTNDVANTKSWTSLSNAQGANNGTKSNWDGSLAIAQLGTMHGTLVSQASRPATLIIDEVWLALWGDWSGLPGVDDLLSGLSVGYRIGAAPALDVTVVRRAVSSGSDAGTEFRIDDGAGAFTDTLSTAMTWANLTALQFWAKGQTLIGVASQFNIDAIRLRVVAHETLAL